MFGIAGSIGRNPIDFSRIDAVIASPARRGPDAWGTWQGIVGESAVSLLHTRLTIFDLDARADQPFEWDGCALIHNGEIYNYPELRDQLVTLGHTFEITSNTEVIVYAYRQWGADCVKYFEGMWRSLAPTRAATFVSQP